MHLVVDGDSLLYSAGAHFKAPVVYYSHEGSRYSIMFPNDEEAQKWMAERADKSCIKYYADSYHYDPDAFSIQKLNNALKKIINQNEPTEMTIFLGQGDNSKHKRELYPHYKSNRLSGKPPTQKALKEYLVNNLKKEGIVTNTILSKTREADEDACELFAKLQSTLGPDATALASIDKDVLYLVPGNKYDYYHDRHIKFSINYKQAILNSMLLSLSGDSSDNVPGLRGVAEPKFINGLLDASKPTSKLLLPNNDITDVSAYTTDLVKQVLNIYSIKVNLALSDSDLIGYIHRTMSLIALPMLVEGTITDIVKLTDWESL